MSNRFQMIANRSSQGVKRVGSGVGRVINRFPLITFFLLLALLVGLALAGNQLRKPEVSDEAQAATPKDTQVFTLGTNPEIKVQAKVEKSGVITVTALSGGVVQKVNVKEGSKVNRGSQLVSMSSNYQGGNIQSLSRQIAQKNYQAAVDNYDLQKDSINKNRELAQKGEAQASELREIARKSIDETKTSISYSEQILDTLNQQIKALEATGQTDATTQASLLQLRSSRLQVQSTLSGLRTGLRNTEYLNSDDQEPAQIARLSRDTTLNQLELQQRALDLGKELSLLNLRIAQVSESLMYPAAPCPGVVERVFVNVGQSVAPGTPIATIRANDNSAEAIALLSSDIAKSLSPLNAATFMVDGTEYEVTPRYIAKEPTDGALHAATFSLPAAVAPKLTNNSFIEMTLPITQGLQSAQNQYIPLDSVYQSQDSAYVFVVNDEQNPPVAHSKAVKLGTVYGRYVEVLEGLESGEQVILNRNVLEGDVISIREN